MYSARQTVSSNHQYGPDRQDGAAGLTALLIALILTVCAAASLFLTVPQTVDAAASVAPAAPGIVRLQPAEQPFHERYSIDALAESPDVPTF